MIESIKATVVALRNIGKICFIKTRSISGDCQIVLTNSEEIKKFKVLTIGSSISYEGTRVRGKSLDCKWECKNPKIKILSYVKYIAPVDYSKAELQESLEVRLDNISTSIRSNEYIKRAKVISCIFSEYVDFMSREVKSTYFLSPHLTVSGTDGGSELFSVEYFGNKVFMSQSAQLWKQIMVGGLHSVYTVSPCFRAEKSVTTRHLSESTQMEFESHIENDWSEVIYIATSFVIRAHRAVKLLFPDVEAIDGYHKMSFYDVKSILSTHFAGIYQESEDLSSKEEKAISDYVYKVFDRKMLVITHWKQSSRPFYSLANAGDNDVTNTFDILINGLEVCSGGERINCYEDLKKSLTLHGMSHDKMKFYCDSFKYGMPAHGGFGMGLERLTQATMKLSNIREVSFFPSDTKRVGGIKIRKEVVHGADNIRNRAFAVLNGMISGQIGVKLKSLIVKNLLGENFLIVLPLCDQADISRLKNECNGRLSFEDPDVLSNRYGLSIGDIPPFGDIIGIPMILDVQIGNFDLISFSTGKKGEHVSVSVSDFENAFTFRYMNVVKNR